MDFTIVLLNIVIDPRYLIFLAKVQKLANLRMSGWKTAKKNMFFNEKCVCGMNIDGAK